MINRGILAALSAVALTGSVARAETLATHRLPAALAMEAASETVASCAAQGYHETAQVVDADGVIIATLRGDGVGAHSLDSALDKEWKVKSMTIRFAPHGQTLTPGFPRQLAGIDV